MCICEHAVSVCGLRVCMYGYMWYVCVYAAQIEFFPLSAILKNELILIESIYNIIELLLSPYSDLPQ